MEAYAVRGLALQLGVAEAVQVLEHEELHHHHEVDAGSASHGCVVGVDALDDVCECVPVDMWLYFGESVA